MLRLFLLLIGFSLPGFAEDPALGDFQRMRERVLNGSKPDWPPPQELIEQYRNSSLTQRMRILRNWASQVPVSEEPTLLVRGNQEELNEFLNLFPVEVLQSLDRLGVLIIRVPAGFSRSGYQETIQKKLPGMIVEVDFQISPSRPIPSVDAETQSPYRLAQMDNLLQELNETLGLPRRRIRVAVLDSGCGPHSDLKPLRQSTDENGHGTHVAGILAATQNNGTGIDGVSANVDLRCYSVLNRDGTGTLSALVGAISLAELERNQILLMSLGTRKRSRLLHEVLDAMGDHIILIAASGNEATSEPVLPASHPLVVGVGSINREGKLSSFSNMGRNLDVSTIGENVESLATDGGTRTMSGTSMAAPMMAGILVEILARVPSLPKPADILEALHRAVRIRIRNDPDPNARRLNSIHFKDELLKIQRERQGLPPLMDP